MERRVRDELGWLAPAMLASANFLEATTLIYVSPSPPSPSKCGIPTFQVEERFAHRLVSGAAPPARSVFQHLLQERCLSNFA